MRRRVPLSAAVIVAVMTAVSGCDRFTSVDTRLERASNSIAAGEYQAALVDLRKSLDAEPTNLAAQLLLVDVLMASGDIQGARVQLDRAIASGATPGDVETRQLDLLLATGSVEPLRTTLEASSTLSPTIKAVYEGRLLLLERHPAEAQLAFERALAADASAIEAASGRIEAMAAQGELEEAAAFADAWLQEDATSGRMWFARGLLAARTADFSRATQALDRALGSGGLTRAQRIQAHVVRTESQLAAGELESARQSLAALEADASDVPIIALMRARVALAAGDANTAVNELRRFSQAAPQHISGRLLLISALQDQGSLEQAFAEAARAISEFPNQDEPKLALAGVQLRMGRAADAEDTLQSLVSQTPPNPTAMALMAEIRVRSGNASAGISMLEQSLAGSPDNGRLKLQLAAAHLSADNAQRALQLLDTVSDQDLLAARDRLRVIATAALEGPEQAEQELRSAVQRHPDDVELMLTAAAYAANTGKHDQAREHLNNALKARPGNAMLMQNLAKLELAVGRISEAEALAKGSLEKAPNDAAGMVLMASVAALRGQEAEVDAWLGKARVANPGALEVSLALARRAAVRGDAAQARSILGEAASHAPSNAGIRVALAELMASQGSQPQALAELREAAKLNPESALIPLSAARIHLAAGEYAAARVSLNQSLKLSPGWLPAASLLAEVEVRQGNLGRALAVVPEVRRANPNGNTADVLTGDIYMAAGRSSNAAAAYSAAYQRKPDALAATKALRSKMRAKMERADAEALAWLERNPDDSGTRKVLAEYYLTTGSNSKAATELERVVGARPMDAVALNNLAWLYHKAGDRRALETAKRAYELSPQVAEIADTYGWILVLENQAVLGSEILSKAAAAATDNPDIQLHYAESMAKAGQKERALQVLDGLSRSGQSSLVLERTEDLRKSIE